MIKVLTLATMVGILAQKKQLGTFISSLGKSHITTQNKNNSTPQIVSQVAEIIQEEMQENNGFTKGAPALDQRPQSRDQQSNSAGGLIHSNSM